MERSRSAARRSAGDPTPRWQSLGKVDLAKNHRLKVVVSNATSNPKAQTHRPMPENRRKRSTPQREGDRTGSCAGPAVDLSRARIRPRRRHSTWFAAASTRSSPVTTRGEATRGPTTKASIFRHLHRQVPGATALCICESRCWSLWDYGRCSPRLRSTRRSPASSIAAITRSRRSSSRPFLASLSAATFTGRPR